MSTSLLYQAFGVKGYKYMATRYLCGDVVFEVFRPQEDLRCSACGSIRVIHRGGVVRLIQGVPIGKKRVWLSLEVPRMECDECPHGRWSSVGVVQHRVCASASDWLAAPSRLSIF